MNKRIISLILVISLFSFILTVGVNAAEDDIIEESIYGLVDIGYRPSVPKDDYDLEGGTLDLSTTYDPRFINAVISAKD